MTGAGEIGIDVGVTGAEVGATGDFVVGNGLGLTVGFAVLGCD